MAINAGLGQDLINFVLVTIVFGVGMYFLANFLIKNFNFATPGRNGNYETEGASDAPATASADGNLNPDSQVVKIIHLLGGRENIADVDACMTRLRVSVKNREAVGDEKAWKAAGALGDQRQWRASSLWTESRCLKIRHSRYLRFWCHDSRTDG